MKKIKVFAPATVANVVCGYDILGFAVNNPGDEVELELTVQSGLRIKQITGDGGVLPLSVSKNTVSVGIAHYLKAIGRSELGVELVLHKKMPIGSGLGSSAASTAAGLFAINTLLDNPLTAKELVPFAMKAEAIACGQAHADNVAPALLGGFTLVRSYAPLDVISLPTPKNLYVALVYPEVDVPTRNARKMIRKTIPVETAVSQWGNVAGLVSGLCLEDFDLIGRSLKDEIFEPVRSILIPGFEKMRTLAMENGAIGFGISGSGPSVFSLVTDETKAQQIAEKQSHHLQSINIDNQKYVSPINNLGPKIL